ncbi:hypothetical protein LTS18_006413 [Coniosporium uncinatum]|uniref:Uncharacterized protein n=1 Tax=Coniosporium uncinatum TaxID=93489 RepID=A0ACC3DCL6_9PEZI|nr:hypothetical protein LTS18_006413 [Coniosporium uncinatum]
MPSTDSPSPITPAKAVIPFLVAMMLLTGVCNTLLTKYQDMQCVRDCDTATPEHFEQPVIQTAQMFVGEMGCWLVIAGAALYRRFVRGTSTKTSAGYERIDRSSSDPLLADAAVNSSVEEEEEEEEDTLVSSETDSPNPIAKPLIVAHPERMPLEGWKVVYMAIPAVCDICGTTLMNVGLLFVAASIYQMTRGALVLFVGVFSVLFLKRRLAGYKWLALFVVVAGVAVVGIAGAIAKDHKATPGHSPVEDPEQKALYKQLASTGYNTMKDAATPEAIRTVVGVLLIAAAQIFTATQFVVEESIMEKYSLEPLQAVGWEGLWGFLVTVLGMIVLHFAYGRTDKGRYGYFDAQEGLRELGSYRAIAVSSVLIMISIGGFNFFGLSVTRTVSATSRSTIDTCRTLFIWIVSLGLGWETFKWLQVLGFALLVYGTFLFNDIVRPPLQYSLGWRRKRREELLPEALGEHN